MHTAIPWNKCFWVRETPRLRKVKKDKIFLKLYWGKGKNKFISLKDYFALLLKLYPSKHSSWWRRLEDIIARRLANTSWRSLKDALGRRIANTSEDVFKTSLRGLGWRKLLRWRRFWEQEMFPGIFKIFIFIYLFMKLSLFSS